MAREFEKEKSDNGSLLDRRSYLKMAGSAVAATAVGATGLAASQEYETITVSAGEHRSIDVGSGETFENQLIDITADGAGVAFTMSGDGWTIRNVGVKGEHNGESFIMMPGVSSADGEGVIENVYLGDGTRARKGGGGIWVDANLPHQGVITLRRVHLAHTVNNGLYASGVGSQGATGITNVEDSYFHSNNIANIRMNAKGDRTPHVKNTVVKVDDSTPRCGENCSKPGAVNNRGVWSWYGVTEVINSDIQGGMVGTDGGEVRTKGTQTGESANTKPPKGVPMSAEKAASGGK